MALSSLALTRLWFLNISILRLCCLVHGVLLPTNTLRPLIILEGCFLTIYHMHALRLVWKHHCVVSALLLHIYHSHICLLWLSLNSLIWTLTCRFTKFVFELYNFLLNKKILEEKKIKAVKFVWAVINLYKTWKIIAHERRSSLQKRRY